jgi:hypothetical protein
MSKIDDIFELLDLIQIVTPGNNQRSLGKCNIDVMTETNLLINQTAK